MLATSDLLQMLHRLFVLFMLLIIQLYWRINTRDQIAIVRWYIVRFG
jgi:hypothetical protein